MTIAITAPVSIVLVAVAAPRFHDVRLKTAFIKGEAGSYVGLKPENIVIACAF